MTPHRRGPWSNAEDAYLMNLVQTHGPLNWVRIAQTLGSRTPKQCRERYHQNLKPSLNHEPITPEEGAQIEQLVEEIGKRWAEIARRLNGRSDNAVKNWWNGSQNRRKRLDRRRVVQAGPPSEDPYYRPTQGMVPPPLPQLRSPHDLRHQSSWIEPPLPSPCSSESAESDASSNYTTSPGRYSFSYHPPVELPPIRGGPATLDIAPSRDPKLPSFSHLVMPLQVDRLEAGPRLPPMTAGAQLPTAPNSPMSQKSSRTSTIHLATQDKDSRMNVSALLE